MTYREAAACLNSFINYEKKSNYPYKKSFELKRIKGFLRLLGNPQGSLCCLHIAGTKGKGSVCAFTAHILREAGYKVGLYTSPHLLDFRERIRVLSSHQSPVTSHQSEFEGMIGRRELAALVQRLRPLIEKYNSLSKHGTLTFFEVFTALAFQYFKEQNVDYAVLETGLGGRLDATNVVNPLVCAITPISYDHTDKLGATLRRIAKEKAGIIKNQKPIVISAAQEKEAREVIKERCENKGARLYELGKDILLYKRRIRASPSAWFDDTHHKPLRARFQPFDVKGLRRNYHNLKVSLPGEHQLDNAALAIGMVEALNNARITPLAIRRGLKNALWPGRLEVVNKKPTIILDGAQNAASASALKEAIKNHFNYERLILILGISCDKDIRGIGEALCSIADRIILTKVKNPRAAEPGAIKRIIAQPSELTHNVKEAIALAKRLADSKDLILITGSLFLVGEARDIVKSQKSKIKSVKCKV